MHHSQAGAEAAIQLDSCSSCLSSVLQDPSTPNQEEDRLVQGLWRPPPTPTLLLRLRSGVSKHVHFCRSPDVLFASPSPYLALLSELQKQAMEAVTMADYHQV